MTSFVLVIVATVMALAGWVAFEAAPALRPGRRLFALVLVMVAGAALIAQLFGSCATGHLRTVQGLFALALAIAGGAIVTTAVFEHIDAGATGTGGSSYSIEAAGDVLRGGAWIGALERTAIFATVVAGWPQGVAVVLAVKALGRYPELRTPGVAGQSSFGPKPTPGDKAPSGATERFIIGTMASVIWAAMAVYLAVGH